MFAMVLSQKNYVITSSVGFTTGIPWVQFYNTIPLPINTVTVAGEGMTPYMFGYSVIPKNIKFLHCQPHGEEAAVAVPEVCAWGAGPCIQCRWVGACGGGEGHPHHHQAHQQAHPVLSQTGNVRVWRFRPVVQLDCFMGLLLTFRLFGSGPEDSFIILLLIKFEKWQCSVQLTTLWELHEHTL